MHFLDWMTLIIFISLMLIISPLLGKLMGKIFEGQPNFLSFLFGWLERWIYKVSKVNPRIEMTDKEYLACVILFNLIGLVVLFLIQVFQYYLPLNPQNFFGVDWPLALNTSVSFVTNAGWQAYSGETTLSYFSQMAGITVQNFLSAATGNAVMLAFIRGLLRQSHQTLGNFWVDVTRTIVYLLLPLAILLAIFLMTQGVIQNLHPNLSYTTLENEVQVIPMGPVASQEAIKQLGTNGGGFFNANSAHPFENPTPLTNFVNTFALLMIPAATYFMYGYMIKSQKQGFILFAVIMVIWGLSLSFSLLSEHIHNPILPFAPIMEGKETRIGLNNSVLWAMVTSSTGNGSVNNSLTSLSPLAGGIAMLNIMLGGVIFGGIGTGLCALLMCVIFTVFLAGLMVGRTPEYLGKKIEKKEIQWAMVALLFPGALLLLGSALASVYSPALESLTNQGPHGLSEILYAFSSTAGNNGSAFQGLAVNTNFYNFILSFLMLSTRLVIFTASLLVAGSLGRKMTMAPSLATFPTDSPLFGILLFFVIIIVIPLSFFPALSLGPVLEHFLMLTGRTF